MIERLFSDPLAQQDLYGGPLASYVNGFAAQLAIQGYADSTAKEKLQLVAHLSRWLQRHDLPLAALDEERVRQFLVDPGWTPLRPRRGDAPTCRMLLDYLRELGSIPPPTEVIDDTPLRCIESGFAHYLVAERGLSAATVINYSPTVHRFLEECFGTGEVKLDEISPRDVHRFLLRHAPRVSRGRAKLMVTALRSFFGFLRQRGDITSDLAAAIPAMTNWRLTGLPLSLRPEQVEALLDSCDQDTALGQRDYAILLLLARLGLRAGEVVGLTLDDLDWDTGSLIVRGKGKRQERLPLPQDVGEAVANYLRQSRPHCVTRRVFIRLRAPHRGFSSSVAIDNVVHRALDRTGLDPAQKGAHLLRHSLATRLLGSGASLEQIGQLLRHAHPQTTEIYAKVNLRALRALAQPWPGGGV
jgi:site-specific recombinase XerD